MGTVPSGQLSRRQKRMLGSPDVDGSAPVLLIRDELGDIWFQTELAAARALLSFYSVYVRSLKFQHTDTNQGRV